MQKLPEATLTAIGRMTVAATDLERLLAWIGADQAGGDAAVFGQPGAALAAARGSVQFAAVAVRDELIQAVEAVGAQLAMSQAMLRRLWQDEQPVDAAVFDAMAGQLLRCREWLAQVVDESCEVSR